MKALVIILLFSINIQAADKNASLIFGVGQENFEFELGDIGGAGKLSNLKFYPNMVGVTRVGLNIYGFGLGYSFRGSNKDLDANKGNTDFFDLQLGYNQRDWGVDAYYQTYEGFYTTETTSLQLYPDLKFQHQGILGRYALTEGEFSIGGLHDQSENITQTSGKLYLVGGLRKYTMESPTSLLLQNYSGVNSELESLRSLNVTSLKIGFGAGKYWVSTNKIFFGALLDLITTYGFYRYDDMNLQTTRTTNFSLSYDAKIGLGYAGEHFKFGLGTSTDTTTLSTPGKSYIVTRSLRGLFYIRYKF